MSSARVRAQYTPRCTIPPCAPHTQPCAVALKRVHPSKTLGMMWSALGPNTPSKPDEYIVRPFLVYKKDGPVPALADLPITYRKWHDKTSFKTARHYLFKNHMQQSYLTLEEAVDNNNWKIYVPHIVESD